MHLLLTFLIGFLSAASFYLLLSPHMIRFMFGTLLFANTINLLIFLMGRLREGMPPIIPEDQVLMDVAANPLPQALVLTAIVIGFAFFSFTCMTILRLHKTSQTINVLRIRRRRDSE